MISLEWLFVHSSCKPILLVMMMFMFLYSLCTLSLGETIYMTGKVLRNSIHCTWDWWFCFSAVSAALAQHYILHAGCVSLWRFIVVTDLVIYLIAFLVKEVEWGHVGSFTGISREQFWAQPHCSPDFHQRGDYFSAQNRWCQRFHQHR